MFRKFHRYNNLSQPDFLKRKSSLSRFVIELFFASYFGYICINEKQSDFLVIWNTTFICCLGDIISLAMSVSIFSLLPFHDPELLAWTLFSGFLFGEMSEWAWVAFVLYSKSWAVHVFCAWPNRFLLDCWRLGDFPLFKSNLKIVRLVRFEPIMRSSKSDSITTELIYQGFLLTKIYIIFATYFLMSIFKAYSQVTIK